jgi:hypothetical protein
MPAFSAKVRETIRFSRSSCRLLPIRTTSVLGINRRSTDHQTRSEGRSRPSPTNLMGYGGEGNTQGLRLSPFVRSEPVGDT